MVERYHRFVGTGRRTVDPSSHPTRTELLVEGLKHLVLFFVAIAMNSCDQAPGNQGPSMRIKFSFEEEGAEYEGGYTAFIAFDEGGSASCLCDMN